MSIALANVTTTAANVYTSSGNTAVTFMSLCNYSTGNVTANVFIVPSGNTPGNLNVVLANILILSGDTYQLYQANEKLLFATNDTIRANASSDNSLTAITSYTSV